MKIFPGENEKIITVAIVAFCGGALLGLGTEIDDKLAEILLPTVATLAAAFFGARYAFALQNNKREAEIALNRVEAGNRAIFQLANIYTKVCNFRDQFIEEHRKSTIRCVAIKPAIGLGQPIEIDFDSLVFLLQSKDPNILAELYQFQSMVYSAYELILSRSNLHAESVQPRLEEEAASDPEHRVDTNKIRDILGERTYVTLVQNTDDMIESVDAVIADSDVLVKRLRRLLTQLFPGHVIIDFKKRNNTGQ